jgi:hypothetical protein
MFTADTIEADDLDYCGVERGKHGLPARAATLAKSGRHDSTCRPHKEVLMARAWKVCLPGLALLAACEDQGNPGDDSLLTGGSLVVLIVVAIVVFLVIRRRR